MSKKRQPGVPEETTSVPAAETLRRVREMNPTDLVSMFGTLAAELVERRRDSEIDIMRCERFHPEGAENLLRHRTQHAAYTRRLLAASAIVRLLNCGASESLFTVISGWAETSIGAKS